MTGYAGLPADSLRSESHSLFEAQQNILACMSTCKYVACPAWELLAKPTAHDLCSKIHLPLEWSWTVSGLCCLLSPRGTVLFFHELQLGWLWLQNLYPGSALPRTGIPRDFTITIIICTVEFSGFFSTKLWIKPNSSSMIGKGVQEAKKSHRVV